MESGLPANSGRLSLAQLSSLIRRGEIDTVLAVFPDMLGRWMGKRVTGRFFLDSVASHGAHACAYLLTVDMEMDPVQGFDLTSWEKGYGDFKMIPDMQTLRHILIYKAELRAVFLSQILDRLKAATAVGTLEIGILDQGVWGVFVSPNERVFIDHWLERVKKSLIEFFFLFCRFLFLLFDLLFLKGFIDNFIELAFMSA